MLDSATTILRMWIARTVAVATSVTRETWVVSLSLSNHKYIENETITMRNISVNFGGQIFQQTIGVQRVLTVPCRLVFVLV